MSESKSPITFIADVEIAQKLRLKLKTGTTTEPPEVDIAGVGVSALGIGVNQYLVAAGKDCAVKQYGAGETIEMVAAGAFAVGATIYGAAAGKVDDVSSGTAIGIAMEAATADGDIVEILPSIV